MNGIGIGFTRTQVEETLGPPLLACSVPDDNETALSYRVSEYEYDDSMLVHLDRNNNVRCIKQGTELQFGAGSLRLGDPIRRSTKAFRGTH